MKIIKTITAYCKKPKVGQQLCGWGVDAIGYSCSEIKKVCKNHIVLVNGKKYSLESWYEAQLNITTTKQKSEMNWLK